MENSEKKSIRLTNIRPLFVVFIFFVVGIFTAVQKIVGQNFPIYFLYGFFILSIIGVFVAVFKKYKNAKKLVSLLFLIILPALIGNVYSVIFYNLKTEITFAENEYYVEARVCKFSVNDNNTLLIVEEPIIENTKCNFNIILSVYVPNYSFKVGDIITFVGKLKQTTLSNGENGINVFLLKNNIQYASSISTNDFTVKDGSLHLDEIIKSDVKNYLDANMSSDESKISYAVLFGEKDELDTKIYQVFQYSGLAHTLSVSGLHIGFLVVILSYFLKKLKLNKKYHIFVILPILFFYSYLCGFYSSVLRATVMTACFLLAYSFGERGDGKSSFSLAGILLLLICPFLIYDVGFLLSFVSVFGIMYLQSPIKKLFYKIKIVSPIADMLAVTISATISTIPIIAHYFGFIAVISLLSNLIILPIFSVYYSLLFVTCILGTILNAGFLLFPTAFLISSLLNLSKLLAKCGVITLPDFTLISSIMYYLSIFALSKFLMLKFKYKLICVNVLMCLNVLIIAEHRIPQTFNYFGIYSFESIENCCLVTTETNKKILIGGYVSEEDLPVLQRALYKLKVFEIDEFIAIDYEDKYQENVAFIFNNYNVQNLVLPDNLEDATISGLCRLIYTTNNLVFTNFENLSLDNNLILDLLFANTNEKVIKLQTDSFSFGLVLDKLTQAQASEINVKSNNVHFNSIVANSYSTGLDYLFCDIIFVKDKVERDGYFSIINYSIFKIYENNNNLLGEIV